MRFSQNRPETLDTRSRAPAGGIAVNRPREPSTAPGIASRDKSAPGGYCLFAHGRVVMAPSPLRPREDSMLKYIGIILALMPFLVLAKGIFMRTIKR